MKVLGSLGDTSSESCSCSSPVMPLHAQLPSWASSEFPEVTCLGHCWWTPVQFDGMKLGPWGATALQIVGTTLGRQVHSISLKSSPHSLHPRWAWRNFTRWEGDNCRDGRGLNRSEVLWKATVPLAFLWRWSQDSHWLSIFISPSQNSNGCWTLWFCERGH
jgi:hypothetical protein